MSTNTKLAEALAQYEAALLSAYPEGARGVVFDCWNAARQALAAHEAEQAVPAVPDEWTRRMLLQAATAIEMGPRASLVMNVEGVVDNLRRIAAAPAPEAQAARAALAQRQPLTDEQIESIRAQVFAKALQRCDGCDHETWDHWFARAIEAAHGIGATTGEQR